MKKGVTNQLTNMGAENIDPMICKLKVETHTYYLYQVFKCCVSTQASKACTHATQCKLCIASWKME
jgi:hypothetical protein